MEKKTDNKDCKEERYLNTDILWSVLLKYQGHTFYTAKHLEFTYTIRGKEMFVSRKDKSITRSTIDLAFEKALQVQEKEGGVAGPKKLGCFGASYLYPIFLEIGVISLPKRKGDCFGE